MAAGYAMEAIARAVPQWNPAEVETGKGPLCLGGDVGATRCWPFSSSRVAGRGVEWC